MNVRLWLIFGAILLALIVLHGFLIGCLFFDLRRKFEGVFGWRRVIASFIGTGKLSTFVTPQIVIFLLTVSSIYGIDCLFSSYGGFNQFAPRQGFAEHLRLAASVLIVWPLVCFIEAAIFDKSVDRRDRSLIFTSAPLHDILVLPVVVLALGELLVLIIYALLAIAFVAVGRARGVFVSPGLNIKKPFSLSASTALSKSQAFPTAGFLVAHIFVWTAMWIVGIEKALELATVSPKEGCCAFFGCFFISALIICPTAFTVVGCKRKREET